MTCELALLAAKNESSTIVPGALIAADKMLDKKYANATKMIPSSDTNIYHRIHDMAQDVEQMTKH